ncbi:MAG TPA: hypothetical protein ENN63_05090 [Bacteroidetes bacterium]|nr:hypothetical protein [Bacteroidota bacterium]
MAMRKYFSVKLLIPLTVLFTGHVPALADGNIVLYTPYTKISVPPGQTVDYSIDVKNNGNNLANVPVYVSGLPSGWDHNLMSGGWNIQQISVLPGESKNMTLTINVPMKVNKGNYAFQVVARGYGVLPLVVHVSEQGTYKSEFTCQQANMQGHATSGFTFSTQLKNHTGEKQLYSLQANPPRGWEVIFKPNYKQATAVEIEPNATTNITVEVKPPYNVKAGTYKIPLLAVNNATSAELELEVVITGKYEMELTTPSGLLSSSITAGKEKTVELLLKNTGSSPLDNIRFSASKPVHWEVSFDPDTIPHLEAGENFTVKASIRAYDKAIPGDYVVTLSAQTPETSSKASFRMSVKTPLLWGWLGILIILAVIAVIYYLFRKYGRR